MVVKVNFFSYVLRRILRHFIKTQNFKQMNYKILHVKRKLYKVNIKQIQLNLKNKPQRVI